MSPAYRYFKTLYRIIESLLIRLLLQPLKLLPVKKNRVLFTAFMEKQYACNPKYISRELKRLYGDKVEILWSFRHPERFPDLEKEEGVKVIGSSNFKYYVYALTSRVIVTNTLFKPTLPRRRGTLIINTWHGGGSYKKIQQKFFDKIRRAGIKLYMSSSRAFTNETIRGSLNFKGEVMEVGMPRNDILLNPPSQEKIDEIRAKIGLKPGQKLCLYAPTWQKDWVVHYNMPDYEQTVKALSERFGGEWVMGYRSHHVTMYLDQIKVQLGRTDFELKISKIAQIYPYLEGRNGTINMTNYSSSDENIILK